MNDAIRAPKVRCIDPEGAQLGVLETSEAIRQAEDFGLDLVEVGPKDSPPICKLLDFGRFKFQSQRKQKQK